MLEGVPCKKMQYLQFANGKKRSFFYLYFDMRPHYEKVLTSKSLGVCIIAFLLIDRRHYQYSIHFLASVCYHKPKNWIDDCFPMTFSNHLQRCFALQIEITQLICMHVIWVVRFEPLRVKMESKSFDSNFLSRNHLRKETRRDIRLLQEAVNI